jgi:hypothetical protein
MRTWPTETIELAPGVFAYIQATGGLCVANAGLIDAPGGATDVPFSPPMTRAFRKVDTGKPLT